MTQSEANVLAKRVWLAMVAVFFIGSVAVIIAEVSRVRYNAGFDAGRWEGITAVQLESGEMKYILNEKTGKIELVEDK